MNESPLSEADPILSMQEIMSRDPLELTRQDRDRIISELRKARANFAASDSQPKVKRGKKLEPVDKVSLDDLLS